MSFTKQLADDDGKSSLAFPVRPSARSFPLTLVSKFDVFLVRRGEDLLLLLVCGESRSRVVVLLAVEAVEDDLGCREADG